ncbi:MAG: hypothetical protein KBG83_00190 [Bacteroidetes bacterium]|nr:hypothetical protein [Bacteroidota bacterium]
MTPKVVYTLNGTTYTKIFELSDFTAMKQEWERDELEYKHPFTGKITRKCRGYYYKATLSFEGVPYDLMGQYRDILYSKITDLKFYPNKDSAEYYAVDVNEKFEYDDSSSWLMFQNFELIFRGKDRFEHPLNYPQIYWGARATTFDDIGNKAFNEFA